MTGPGTLGELVYVTEVAPYRSPGSSSAPTAAGVHHGLASSVIAMEQLAALNGLSFRHAASAASLGDAGVAGCRVLVLATIGETPWSTAQRQVVEERWRSGALGIVGLHSATDASYGWEAYGDFIGARFDGHPMTTELPVARLDADHPATAHLPEVWRFRDELYLFREMHDDLRVLLALRMGPVSGFAAGEKLAARDLPLAWCQEHGRARSFYSALGHFTAAWEDTSYLRHVQGGVAWVLGEGADSEDG